MRPVVLLAHVALWASSTHAFYPYEPEWHKEAESEKRVASSADNRRNLGETGVRFDVKQRNVESTRPLSERVAAQIDRLATKYAGRHLPKAPVDKAFVRRDNEYNVMEANEPDGELSAGIDQDGTDYSYFVEVGIGSKQKKLYMLVDTGAGSSWVMGSDCTSDACGLHTTFGSDDSTTLEKSSEPFSIAYGSGKVSGSLAKDTFHLAGMSFDYQFGLTTTTSDQFTSFAFDGILGFSLNTGANQNFLGAVADSHELDQNIFCIALNRAEDGENNGEIRFGSINKDKFTGDITYTSLEDGDDWAIELGDMGYDGSKANVGGVPSYIDTGTSFIFGPSDSVTSLHSLIPGAESSDNKTWTVPCDSNKNLTITFSGASYQISPKDWISPKSKSGTCTSNIYGHEVVQGAWLLGDTFLKNVYAVFDKDKRRIGFANNAVTDASESESEEATKTASSYADSTHSTHVSALPDTTATADMGLGKESLATDTATAVSSKATSSTKDSSATSRATTPAYFTFIFCTITLFALLA
ncbi:aspartic peptidase domain-containing protein [Thelonectria olida]|uniref:Aspartic peptidase domain-containing protein n=1 Tax=Thelonectria olida TaxID=1576542 RepID=A0A9P9AUK0_9HYPO|nr:aspartic peptidase domain-containing protein [Thelonectria olida]